MTKRLSDLTTTKAFYQVDDVDLLRANTDNTWPVTARYAEEVEISKSNVLLDIDGSANVALTIPYHFDIGPNVYWSENNLNGQITIADFARDPDPSNTSITVSNIYGRGSSTANIELRQPDANLDIFSVNVYANTELLDTSDTIRKTSGGNYDVIIYDSRKGDEQQSEYRFKVAYDCNVSVLCIGGGGGGGNYGLSGGGGGGGLIYLNDIPLQANDNVIIRLGLGGSAGRTTSGTSNRGNTGGATRFTMVRGVSTFVDFYANGGIGGLDQDDFTRTAQTGEYDYLYSYGQAGGGSPFEEQTHLYNARGLNSITSGGGRGGRAGGNNISTGSYGGGYNYVTGEYSRACGGGAGGFVGGQSANVTYGGVTNNKVLYDSSPTISYSYTTNPPGDWLSDNGGGAGGILRASSVFDQGGYSGYGTGIYGWNGHNARAEWVNNPGTYPTYNRLEEAKYYGGYGASINGTMDPTFTTTTPSFGAGAAPGGAGGGGIVRIMFDGDKRKFPNTNCGLEVQTTSHVFLRSTFTLTTYNGTVEDTDYDRANIFAWDFQVIS